MEFSEVILSWYEENKRTLPWRGSRNPYEIWLSEIILQQTRIEQGLPYYEKFIAAFPTVYDLANASEDQILKLWQGLGYYSRARNLHATAIKIVEEYNGIFPDSFEGLIKLKGIGTYTAAAIASFAFNLPTPVVDGNVYRLLSRYFGIKTPIDSTIGKKEFNDLAIELINRKYPAIYNQAIMEFGSRQCKPQSPDCLHCPLNLSCIALKEKTVEFLPVKAKSIAVRNRYFYYLLIKDKNKFLLHKRTGNDIWKNLYQLPMIETDKPVKQSLLMKNEGWATLFKTNNPAIISSSESIIHKLSHQTVHAIFIEVTVKKLPAFPADYFWVNTKNYHQYAIPKLIENFLSKYFRFDG
jgi:A/G-specific adenine glycosylase